MTDPVLVARQEREHLCRAERDTIDAECLTPAEFFDPARRRVGPASPPGPVRPAEDVTVPPLDLAPTPRPEAVALADADRDEFAVVRKVPVLDRHHRAYLNVRQYVADRTLFFGAPSDYVAFAAESDAELATTAWVGRTRTRTLRSMIEFGKATQARQHQVFYRWVRRAYKVKYGGDADVPELIRKGMSDELASRLAAVRGSARVKAIDGGDFKAGGFNPRPVKWSNHYLLGTLSEHATGMAIDIDDARNPQLTADEWKFIEGLTDTTVKRSGRWATEADAEGIWTDIHDLSDLFVTAVADAAATTGPKGPPPGP